MGRDWGANLPARATAGAGATSANTAVATTSTAVLLSFLKRCFHSVVVMEGSHLLLLELDELILIGSVVKLLCGHFPAPLLASSIVIICCPHWFIIVVDIVV